MDRRVRTLADFASSCKENKSGSVFRARSVIRPRAFGPKRTTKRPVWLEDSRPGMLHLLPPRSALECVPYLPSAAPTRGSRDTTPDYCPKCERSVSTLLQGYWP